MKHRKSPFCSPACRASFKIQVVFILLSAFTLSDCAIKKRTYRNGYYVEWAGHRKNVQKAERPARVLKSAENVPLTEEAVVLAAVDDKSLPVKKEQAAPSLRVWQKPVLQPAKHEKQARVQKDSCGDVLVLRNGDVVNGKVIEVTARQVIYRTCGSNEVFNVPLSGVFKAQYANGTRIVFPIVEQEKEVNNMAALSLYFAAMCVTVIMTIPGIITGIIGLSQIKKHPEKYIGKKQALAGLWINAIFLAAVMVLILVLLLV